MSNRRSETIGLKGHITFIVAQLMRDFFFERKLMRDLDKWLKEDALCGNVPPWWKKGDAVCACKGLKADGITSAVNLIQYSSLPFFF